MKQERAPVLDVFQNEKDAKAIPLWPLTEDGVDAWRRDHAGGHAAWAETNKFNGAAGSILLLPDGSGGLAGVLLGLGKGDDPLILGALPGVLPSGRYRLSGDLPGGVDFACLAWALGAYAFTRYRSKGADWPKLILPDGVDGAEIARIVEAVHLVRDLVNTPANDMGPAELAAAAAKVAKTHDAECRVIEGDALLRENYPMIHAVGRASAAAPRLIDIRWGDEVHPKLTLVGKGVCFDTGGLNLKTGSSMALMKKDMGGAAHVLGLAAMIMGAGLPVRLRVLIAAVENSIAGNAFRPGDVLLSRKGLTVEIGNTDAEGRLILADALSEADAEAPDLLIDMATLTGAARTALGPDLPPFYTDDEAFAAELQAVAGQVADPLWRLPLWQPYESWLDSKIADLNHISEGPFAGSITAALFLKRFVERANIHVHIDIYAWNPKPRPGRPVGGEAQAIRALYACLKNRYLSDRAAGNSY